MVNTAFARLGKGLALLLLAALCAVTLVVWGIGMATLLT